MLHLLGRALRKEDVHQALVGVQGCSLGKALCLLRIRSSRLHQRAPADNISSENNILGFHQPFELVLHASYSVTKQSY